MADSTIVQQLREAASRLPRAGEPGEFERQLDLAHAKIDEAIYHVNRAFSISYEYDAYGREDIEAKWPSHRQPVPEARRMPNGEQSD